MTEEIKYQADISTESYLFKMHEDEFYLIVQVLVGLNIATAGEEANLSYFKNIVQPWKWSDLTFDVFRENKIGEIGGDAITTMLPAKLKSHCGNAIDKLFDNKNEALLVNNDSNCWLNAQAVLASTHPSIAQALNLKFVFDVSKDIYKPWKLHKPVSVLPRFKIDQNGTIKVFEPVKSGSDFSYKWKDEIGAESAAPIAAHPTLTPSLTTLYEVDERRLIDPYYGFSWVTPKPLFDTGDKTDQLKSHFFDDPLLAGENHLADNAELTIQGAHLFADYIERLPEFEPYEIEAISQEIEAIIKVMIRLWQYDLNILKPNSGSWFEHAGTWDLLSEKSSISKSDLKNEFQPSDENSLTSLFVRSFISDGEFPVLQSGLSDIPVANMSACSKEVMSLAETLMLPETVFRFFNKGISELKGAALNDDDLGELNVSLRNWRIWVRKDNEPSLLDISRETGNAIYNRHLGQRAIANMRRAGKAIVERINELKYDPRDGPELGFAEFQSNSASVEGRLQAVFVEADHELAKRNVGANVPPQIVIPIDSDSSKKNEDLGSSSSGQESNTTEYSRDDDQFDLQDMYQGYGLLLGRDGMSFVPNNVGNLILKYGDGLSDEITSTLVPQIVIEDVRPGSDIRRNIAIYNGQPAIISNIEEKEDILDEVLKLDVTVQLNGDFYKGNDSGMAPNPLPALSADIHANAACFWIGPAGILPKCLRGNGEDGTQDIFKYLSSSIALDDIPVPESQTKEKHPFIHRINLKRRAPVQSPVFNPGISISDNIQPNPDLEKYLTNNPYHPENWPKNPARVVPLWESVLPALSLEDLTKCQRSLLSECDDDEENSVRRNKQIFKMGVPGVSFEQWKFWMLQERYEAEDGVRSDISKRTRIALQNQMMSSLPGVKMPDPAILRYEESATGGETGTVYKYSLHVSVKQVVATDTASKGQRIGFKLDNESSETIDFFTTITSKVGQPDELNLVKAIQINVLRGDVFNIDNTLGEYQINIVLPKSSEGQKTNLFILECQWLIQKENWFSDTSKYRPIAGDQFSGASQKFVFEVAPDEKSINKQWINPDVIWEMIDLSENVIISQPTSNQISSDSYRVNADLGDRSVIFSEDPFVKIGSVDAVWQKFIWDGQPPTALPLIKDDEAKILKERKAEKGAPLRGVERDDLKTVNDADYISPGPQWEYLNFQQRGEAGFKFSNMRLGNTNKTQLGVITRTRKQKADYFRVRFEVCHRYHGLYESVSQISSERSDVPVNGFDMQALKPWRGFTVKASFDENGGKLPPPNIRWAIPSFHTPNHEVESGSILMQMDEPIYSENSGQYLAENYEVEVQMYESPDGEHSYPMIGNDPIVRGDLLNPRLAELGIAEKVIMPIELARHSIGQTLNPTKGYPVSTGSMFILKPRYQITKEDGSIKSAEVLNPFAMAKIRVRRCPIQDGVYGYSDEGEWSSPYWVQFPATLRSVCKDDTPTSKLMLFENVDSTVLIKANDGSPDGAFKTLKNYSNESGSNKLQFFIAFFHMGLDADGRTGNEKFKYLRKLDPNFGIEGESIYYSEYIAARILLVQKTNDHDIEISFENMFGLKNTSENFGPSQRVVAMSELIQTKRK